MARPPQWAALESRLTRATVPDVFRGDMAGGSPEPIGRWLRAGIADGTPLAPGARLRMRGSIKLGRWLPFRAEQVLAPRWGTVWVARVAGVISGSDQHLDGAGGMDWRLLRKIRILHAEGADVARSSAGRVAGESVWVPTAVAANPMRALDDHTVEVDVDVAGELVPVRHRIDDRGRVTASWFSRWGDPDRTGTWALHPFGLEATGWRSFGGVTIPSAGRVGWHYGTPRWAEGMFFRFEIERLELLPSGGAAGAPSPSHE
jgi:hypothetical protein